jgi:hypothetical protein
VTLANLSFETAGSGPGDAASWTWDHGSAFAIAAFTGVGGAPVRTETFEVGWGCDVREATLPDTADGVVSAAATFGTIGTPTFDGFESQWHMPAAAPLDPTDPGNALNLFAWEAGQAAFFGGSALAETFDWPADYLTVFNQILNLQVAAPDGFEGWFGGYAFSMPATTAAVFGDGTTHDDFEAVAPDVPVSFVAPDLVHFLGAPPVTLVPGLYSGLHVTFYNAGGSGALPPEVDPRVTYIAINASTGYLKISNDGSTPLSVSAATGNNWLKDDVHIYWTQTDVGV